MSKNQIISVDEYPCYFHSTVDSYDCDASQCHPTNCRNRNALDKCLYSDPDSSLSPFQLLFGCVLDLIENNHLFTSIPIDCRMMILQHILDSSDRCECGDCVECSTNLFDNHPKVAQHYEHFLNKELFFYPDPSRPIYDNDNDDDSYPFLYDDDYNSCTSFDFDGLDLDMPEHITLLYK